MRGCKRWRMLPLALVLACIRPAPAAQTGSVLAGLRLQYQSTVKGVKDNLSGLAYDARTGHLLAVVNRPASLLVLDAEGRVLRRIALRGFEDTEGVALLRDGRVAVTEEGRNQITVFPMPGTGRGEVDYSAAQVWSLDVLDQQFKPGNNGLEGLARDPRGHCMWTVKERAPRAMYKYCTSGRDATFVLDQSAWLVGAHVGTDLSGIEFDPRTGHLLLLSDESARVTEMDRHGHVVAQLDLDGAHGPRPPQPEGITVDGKGHLFIVSEPNLFYRYARK